MAWATPWHVPKAHHSPLHGWAGHAHVTRKTCGSCHLSQLWCPSRNALEVAHCKTRGIYLPELGSPYNKVTVPDWLTLSSSVQCPIGMHRPEPGKIPDFTLLPKPSSQDALQGQFQMLQFTNPTQPASSVESTRSGRGKSFRYSQETISNSQARLFRQTFGNVSISENGATRHHWQTCHLPQYAWN